MSRASSFGRRPRGAVASQACWPQGVPDHRSTAWRRSCSRTPRWPPPSTRRQQPWTSSACHISGRRSSITTDIPTWRRELVSVRIARSAPLYPRKSHRSPVRVRSTAWSRVRASFMAGSLPCPKPSPDAYSRPHGREVRVVEVARTGRGARWRRDRRRDHPPGSGSDGPTRPTRSANGPPSSLSRLRITREDRSARHRHGRARRPVGLASNLGLDVVIGTRHTRCKPRPHRRRGLRDAGGDATARSASRPMPRASRDAQRSRSTPRGSSVSVAGVRRRRSPTAPCCSTSPTRSTTPGTPRRPLRRQRRLLGSNLQRAFPGLRVVKNAEHDDRGGHGRATPDRRR